VIAGAESLVMGVAVLLGGSLLLIHAWAALDTHMALDAAAREYLRAYTQADSPAAAEAEARRALNDVLADRERLTADVSVTPPDPARFGPCSPALVELSAPVPALGLPFLGTLEARTVTVRHVELVDAHRELDAVGPAYRTVDTACGG
jgi:hypothetical protein